MKKLLTLIMALSLILTACNQEDNSSNNNQEANTESQSSQEQEQVASESEETETEESETEEGQTEESGDESHYPVTVETYGFEDEHLEQTYENQPERVVSAALSGAEELMELGKKDSLVGIMQFDNPPSGKWADDLEEIPEVLVKTDITYENILKSEPDLLISKKDMLDWNNISVKQLNQSGVNVYVQEASVSKNNPGLEAVITDVRNLGTIMNAEERAEELAADLEDRLVKIEEESAKIEEEQTVLNMLNLKDNSFISFNMQEGFHKNLLGLAKLKPIRPEGKNFTYEDIVELNPDVILYVVADSSFMGEEDKQEVLDTLSQPIFSDVNAVKNEKVFFVLYDDYMEFGLRAFDAAEELIKMVQESEE